MSEALADLVKRELDKLGTQLASQRLTAGDTRLWAVATLTEAAYSLRAVRCTGLLTDDDAMSLLLDAAEVVFSEPDHPVKLVSSVMPDTEGKPN